MKLVQLKQKNEQCVYFAINNCVLFKIIKYKTIKNCFYIFFDFTYKNSKYESFKTFNEAKMSVTKRFEKYIEKYSKSEGIVDE